MTTCQQCEGDLQGYTEDPNRGGERPGAFCSWRCANGNMREHGELNLEGDGICRCPTCLVTRAHEEEYHRG